jgi:hypothetical protein
MRCSVFVATQSLMRSRDGSSADAKSSGSSDASKAFCVRSRYPASKVYAFIPNRRFATASFAGPLSRSKPTRLPASPVTFASSPSRWRTLRISAAVSPFAPPQVIASAMDKLAGA